MGCGSSKPQTPEERSLQGTASAVSPQPQSRPSDPPPKLPEWSEAPDMDRLRGEFRSERLQLRPVMESNKKAWAALQSILRTKGSQLGQGRDVTASGRMLSKYNELKLERAWRITNKGDAERFALASDRVAKELAAITKAKGTLPRTQPLLTAALPAAKKKGLLAQSLRPRTNEGLLLHAVQHDKLHTILYRGLDERFAGTHRGKPAFGEGIYLAEDIGKTDQYVSSDAAYDKGSELHRKLYSNAYRHPGSEVHYALLCRVALGWPALTAGQDKQGTVRCLETGKPIFPDTMRELCNVPGLDEPVAYHSLLVELGGALRRYREVVLTHGEYTKLEYVICYSRQLNPEIETWERPVGDGTLGRSLSFRMRQKRPFFLSHTQRDAAAKLLAAELFAELKDMQHGAWLDVKMAARDEAAMQAGVEDCQCFVAIVTDNGRDSYFSRDMCRKEVRWAVEHGKTIVPVIAAEDKGRVAEFIAEARRYEFDFGGLNFCTFDRSGPRQLRASLEDIIEQAALS